MRVAFLGKGGSGKTTTAAGFVRYATKKHPFVLAIDADVNAHLQHALSFNSSGTSIELGNAYEEISNYFRGNRSDLGERPMVASLPPTFRSNFVMVSPDDLFIRKYATVNGNILLLTVGKYEESDVGSSCYHGKLYSLGIMMHHLLDIENDIVIADTTAGTDNVATSLHLAYDMNIFIVEPTEKSVKVYDDFIKLAPHLTERTFAVANKIEDKEDEAFIRSVIPKERLLGAIPFSDNLRKFEQGQKDALIEFQVEQSKAFDAIYSALKQRKRNWVEYLKHLRQAHKKVSEKWLNAYYNMPLDVDLDTDFDYERAIAKELNSRDKKKISYQQSSSKVASLVR